MRKACAEPTWKFTLELSMTHIESETARFVRDEIPGMFDYILASVLSTGFFVDSCVLSLPA